MNRDATTQSDSELALQIACGEEGGLRTLIQDHGPRVQGFLKKRYPRVWEDAWQLSLTSLVTKIDQFDPDKGRLKMWFLKLAQNCARSLMRAERKHSGVEAHEDIAQDARRPPAHSPSAKQQREAARRAEQIREAIEALPPKERRVIEADLANWKGASGPEEVASAERLAEAWGDTSVNAIHQARHRARNKLREELVRRGVQHEGVQS